jgi:eukaryotic-like serine/threonine-protein kinase
MNLNTELSKTISEAITDLEQTELLKPGTVLGPFLVQSLLGSGAMGHVYKVKQREPVIRDVALKLANREIDRSNLSVVIQFEIEKQALASLHHPNVATLYDAGILETIPPRHYLAMEFVDGQTLDQYISSLTNSPGACDKTVRLFVDICSGVEHAHQRQVLHRDLKPSNVLVQIVDGKAVPKIIDFGVAIGMRAQANQTAGTPEYMAPEQYSKTQKLDARADIHALGVSLAEMLSLANGQLFGLGWNSQSLRSALSPHKLVWDVLPRQNMFEPHVGGEKHELMSAIAGIPKALRMIVAKAVHTNPAERYSSAQMLANDLTAYLQLRPVSAVGGSKWYRTGLFLRRNRLVAGLVTFAALSLLAGFAAAVFGLIEARMQRATAIAQAERAHQTASFLTSILSGIDPDEAKSLDTELLEKILKRAAEDAQTELKDPIMRAEIWEIIGQAYNNISDFKSGEYYGLKAIQSLENHPKLNPKLALNLQMEVARAESGLSKNVQSRDRLQVQCAKAERNFGENDLDVLSCQSALTWELLFTGELSAAVALGERTQKRLKAIGAPLRQQTYCMRAWGAALGDSGRAKEAESVMRDLIAMSIQEFGPTHTRTFSARSSLAITLMQQDRFSEAAELLATLLPETDKLFGAEHQSTLSVMSNYAGALRQSGKIAESGPYYRRALELAIKLYGADNSYSLHLEINNANYEISANLPEQALARLARVSGKVQKQFGEKHPAYAEFLRTRAKALTALPDKSRRTGDTADKSAAKAQWQLLIAWCKAHDTSPDAACAKEAQQAFDAL